MVVGLGVGTIAAYGNATVDAELDEEDYVTVRETGEPDYMGFYELNPQVTRWATDLFTYIADAEARGTEVGLFEGGARIVLERQLERGEGQRFDVLAIDAFSSDAIPIHLLTVEAAQMYLGHLEEDGILAFNVTNRFVDLLPVVQRLAETTGMDAIFIDNYSSSRREVNSAHWVLLTTNQSFRDLEIVHRDEEPMPPAEPLWTDDFSSLFEVVEFNNQ